MCARQRRRGVGIVRWLHRRAGLVRDEKGGVQVMTYFTAHIGCARFILSRTLHFEPHQFSFWLLSATWHSLSSLWTLDGQRMIHWTLGRDWLRFHTQFRPGEDRRMSPWAIHIILYIDAIDDDRIALALDNIMAIAGGINDMDRTLKHTKVMRLARVPMAPLVPSHPGVK